MLKFNLSSHRVVIDPKSLTIKELRDCYDGDEDPLKRGATDVLTYVHLISQIDPDAPYFSAREDEVETLVKMDIWGKDSKADTSQYESLLDAYKLAFETPEVRLQQIFNKKLDQLHDMLSTVSPEIEKSTNAKTGSFTYVTNTRAIMQVMKDLGEVMDAKEQLEERIKNTRKNEVKIRGGRKESFLEKKRIIDAGRRDRSTHKVESNEYSGQANESSGQDSFERKRSTSRSSEGDDEAGEESISSTQRKRNHKVEAEVHGNGPENF